MAKRFDRTRQVFPNPSDSRGHEATDDLARDVQATLGRFDAAQQSQRDRSKERMQRIAIGNKEGRQLQAGRGNLDQIRANLDAADDSERMLRAYNRPGLRKQRDQGEEMWWHGNGETDLTHGDENNPIRRASADLVRAKRNQSAYSRETYGGRRMTAYDRETERKYPSASSEEIAGRQARLDNLMASQNR